MADAFTSEAFYNSARGFAQAALQAHHDRDFPHVPLEAATALDHLLKACLAKRSPALLTELRDERNFQSLLRLLGIPGGGPLQEVRTVSLRNALKRVKTFVKSSAPDKDLEALVDMRDGTVHAALNDEVEQRLLVAFVRHADAVIEDLGEHRDDFWAAYRPVVDALLADASDKVAHHVRVKLEAARASFHRRFGQEPDQVLEVVRRLAEFEDRRDDEVSAACPACESPGTVTGFDEVIWEPDWNEGQVVGMHGTVWLNAEEFVCGVCGLWLDNLWEVRAAGLDPEWEIKGADLLKYGPPPDVDSFYESWREARHEQEE